MTKEVKWRKIVSAVETMAYFGCSPVGKENCRVGCAPSHHFKYFGVNHGRRLFARVHLILLQDFKRILVYGRGEQDFVDEDIRKSCDELKVTRSDEARVHPVWLSDSTS